MKIARVFLSVFLPLLGSVVATAQNRDFGAERIVIDDNAADGVRNTMTIQTSNPLLQNVLLTIPDPGAGAAQIVLAPPGSGAWLLTGNAGTTAGTNFIGTTDSVALHLLVAGGSSNGLILNIFGGIQRDAGGNIRGSHAVDLQLTRSAPDQVASGFYATISGGSNNTASQQFTSVGGGTSNSATNEYATIGGGIENVATNLYATVAGGRQNSATSTGTAVGGGFSNSATGPQSVVSGGASNIASGIYAVVGGGSSNRSSQFYSTVAGGIQNQATGRGGVVAGGTSNQANGNYSAIAGGNGLTIDGDRSFGFLANGGLDSMIVSESNVAVFGNTDLWLANNDSASSQLRFYEANATTGTFPDSTNYTSFEAGTQTSDINYILPLSTAATTTVEEGLLQLDAGTGQLSWVNPASAVTGFVWTLSGNSGTTAGTNFLGTTDSVALHIRTNNVDRLIFNTNGSIQRDTGGNGRGANAIDLQTDRIAATQVASGLQSVVGGGFANTASGSQSTVGGGFNNNAAGLQSVVGGGFANTASGSQSTVGGGFNNNVAGLQSVVGGGINNTASEPFSTVAGGTNNRASGSTSTVGGGFNNTASGVEAVVGGGSGNTASGIESTVGGGVSNTASGLQSTVGGGVSNTASGDQATTAGGSSTTASGLQSVVGGGRLNTASGVSATVGGGSRNIVAGDNSAIPGGNGLTLDAAADGSFGFLGDNAGGSKNMTISTPDVAVFGNTDMWLANNDSSASQLRFYEAYNSNGLFPNGTNYTSFEAGTQTSDINYILPLSTTATTTVEEGFLQLDGGTGQLSWVDPATAASAFAWSLTGNTGTTAGTNFIGTTDSVALHLLVAGGSSNGLILNIFGGIQRDAGGGIRGSHAVDLQLTRSAPSQVASGFYATISGGSDNTASQQFAFVGGGTSNSATNEYATIGGGLENAATNLYATIAGGRQNSATSAGTTIGGGFSNRATGSQSVVSGGASNIASGVYSVVGGGASNRSSQFYSTVAGGIQNQATGRGGVVAGGTSNQANGNYSAIAGGNGLTIDGDRSFGFLANVGLDSMIVSESNVAVFGNTDLWLANNDSASSQIRFYEAYDTAGAFPNGTNYTSFEAGAQASDINYILPTALPTAGQILQASGVAGTTVTLTWAADATVAARDGSDTPTSIATPESREERINLLLQRMDEMREMMRKMEVELRALTNEESMPESRVETSSDQNLHVVE